MRLTSVLVTLLACVSALPASPDHPASPSRGLRPLAHGKERRANTGDWSYEPDASTVPIDDEKLKKFNDWLETKGVRVDEYRQLTHYQRNIIVLVMYYGIDGHFHEACRAGMKYWRHDDMGRWIDRQMYYEFEDVDAGDVQAFFGTVLDYYRYLEERKGGRSHGERRTSPPITEETPVTPQNRR